MQKNNLIKCNIGGTSLVVQWLRLYASTTGDMGSIPGGGTKIPQAAWCGPNNNNNIFVKISKNICKSGL